MSAQNSWWLRAAKHPAVAWAMMAAVPFAAYKAVQLHDWRAWGFPVALGCAALVSLLTADKASPRAV